jgi:hypothetical protein
MDYAGFKRKNYQDSIAAIFNDFVVKTKYIQELPSAKSWQQFDRKNCCIKISPPLLSQSLDR